MLPISKLITGEAPPHISSEERSESSEVVAQKALALADLIKNSKHFIAFTGAGISTTAGIPDFRGPQGIWTLEQQGIPHDGKFATTSPGAIPTPAHMALVELQNRGILKHVVSQNVDGLHGESGVSPDAISELHDFNAVSTHDTSTHDHRTGRKCAFCNEDLLDSIVGFWEDLPEAALNMAEEHAAKADLCLVLGSSLTVSPANEIAAEVGHKRRSKLVVCNLQDTPVDSLADIRIYTDTDNLMIQIMQALQFPIPPFTLRRRLTVAVEIASPGRHQVVIRGLDVDDTPFTFLQSVKVAQIKLPAVSDRFTIALHESLQPGALVHIELEFLGNYGEPVLDMVHVHDEISLQTLYLVEYNLESREWKTQKQGSCI
ncbi:NAD-dependent deacetylase sirtuin-7 [Xylariales sp. PMI_506]|nr:NAD-dependent deacetylase sirtuin-7 [Xylariales sp. PMI_506]